MPDLVARTAKIAADARAAQPTKAENRDSDPDVAAFADDYRKTFGADIWRWQWPEGREWVGKRKEPWPGWYERAEPWLR